MRGDLNLKIFKLESESDNSEWGASYRPDTDKLRTWVVAGVSHLDAQASIGLGREGLLVAGATPVEGKDVVKPPTISNAAAAKSPIAVTMSRRIFFPLLRIRSRARLARCGVAEGSSRRKPWPAARVGW